jgi:phosphatidylglycerol:prolipoprotein diacylglycerol transferase
MFPSIHIPLLGLFGSVTLSVQSLLQALGVLAALTTVERLALRQRLRPDKLWTAAVLMAVTLFVGQRLVLFARGWRDFLAHPLWMMGLLRVRDPRSFVVGTALAVAIGTVYLLANRIALARAANALTAAVLLLLGFVHAGYFAAGAEPGRLTSHHWGLVCSNRYAAAAFGTPLHVPLIPVAAYACLGYALLAVAAAALAARGRDATAAPLVAAGLLTVLLGQFQLHWSGEPLVLGLFTWVQTLGITWTLAGAGLLLPTVLRQR